MAVRKRRKTDGTFAYYPDFYVKVGSRSERVRSPEFTSSGDCKAYIIDIMAKAQRGEHLPFLLSKECVSMRQIANNYIDRYAKLETERSLASVDRSRIERIVQYFGEGTDVYRISIKTYEDWLNGRAGVVQKQTANRERTLLISMMNQAVSVGLLAHNPAAALKRFKKADKIKNVYFTDEEYFKLLPVAPDPVMKALTIVARHTGLRRGEAARLQFEHCDFTFKTLHIYDQKNKEVGSIPMLPETEAQLNLLAAIHGRRTGLVFGLSEWQMTEKFRGMVQAAGLYKPYPNNKTLHSLRHSWGTYNQKEGKDLNATKELMRHKSIAMTTRYAHAADELKRSIAAAGTPKRIPSADELLSTLR